MRVCVSQCLCQSGREVVVPPGPGRVDEVPPSLEQRWGHIPVGGATGR